MFTICTQLSTLSLTRRMKDITMNSKLKNFIFSACLRCQMWLPILDESYSFYTSSSSGCHASFATTEVKQLQVLLLGVLINLVGGECLAFWAAVSVVVVVDVTLVNNSNIWMHWT